MNAIERKARASEPGRRTIRPIYLCVFFVNSTFSLSFSMAAFGSELNKCINPDNSVTFTERQCRSDSQQETISVEAIPGAPVSAKQDSQSIIGQPTELSPRQSPEKDNQREKKMEALVASCKNMIVVSFLPYQDLAMNFQNGGIITYPCISAGVIVRGAAQRVNDSDLLHTLAGDI